MMSDLVAGLVLGYILGSLVSMYASYRNGACDAYYFARDPKHPGGRRAGRIIYKSLNHMYGDIPNPDEDNA